MCESIIYNNENIHDIGLLGSMSFFIYKKIIKNYGKEKANL